MTEEAKRDWLAVAWGTLKDLPTDLLKFGCAAARKTCDHPAKIVPAIFEATAESMKLRQKSSRPAEHHLALPKPDYIKPEEAAAILAEFGLKRNPIEDAA